MTKSFLLTLLSTCLFLSVSFTKVSGQSKSIKAGYYLTIAAYAKNKEHFAIAYTEKVRAMGFDADYDFFPKKNYYFVYLKYYTDFNTSIRDLYQTRKNTQFDDCWVYVMRQDEVVEKALNKEVNSLNDMFAERFKDSSDESIKTDKVQSVSDTTSVSLSLEKEQVSLSENEKVVKSSTKEPTSPVVDLSIKKNSKQVFFSLFFGRTSKEVKGQVQVIDAVNHRPIIKYDGNKVVDIQNPKNGNGNLIFISDVFGYKKVQHDFNYENPLDDEKYPYVTNIEDTLIVNFELSRYTKGDIVTMYNVFFFNDAAIMRPNSKYEINELLNMLEENPNMKIRIHGHSNGGAPGKIISLNKGAANYFSLSGDNKTSIGSSKKLSHERASIMKKYLISKGINPHNIETKAWGGKSEIHHKLSSQAHKNVRVEIEVLNN